MIPILDCCNSETLELSSLSYGEPHLDFWQVRPKGSKLKEQPAQDQTSFELPVSSNAYDSGVQFSQLPETSPQPDGYASLSDSYLSPESQHIDKKNGMFTDEAFRQTLLLSN